MTCFFLVLRFFLAFLVLDGPRNSFSETHLHLTPWHSSQVFVAASFLSWQFFRLCLFASVFISCPRVTFKVVFLGLGCFFLLGLDGVFYHHWWVTVWTPNQRNKFWASRWSPETILPSLKMSMYCSQIRIRFVSSLDCRFSRFRQIIVVCALICTLKSILKYGRPNDSSAISSCVVGSSVLASSSLVGSFSILCVVIVVVIVVVVLWLCCVLRLGSIPT